VVVVGSTNSSCSVVPLLPSTFEACFFNFILKTYFTTKNSTMGRKSKNQASNVDGNNGTTEQDEFVEPTTTTTAPV
jgi:hypothetical protein